MRTSLLQKLMGRNTKICNFYISLSAPPNLVINISTHFEDTSGKNHMGQGYKKASVLTLQSLFRYHSVAEIAHSFAEAGDSFLPAYRQLKMLMHEGQRTRKMPRKDVEYPNNLQVVKERRYAELEEAIAAEKTRRAAEGGGCGSCQSCRPAGRMSMLLQHRLSKRGHDPVQKWSLLLQAVCRHWGWQDYH